MSRARDAGVRRTWPMVLGAAAAIVALAATVYCAAGYLHYKRIADDERAAAQRAERANADLQDALNRLRDELAVTQAQIDTAHDEAAPQIEMPRQDQADRITQLTPARALFDLPLDTELKMPAATLNWQPAPHSGRVSAQPRARSSRDQTRATLRQLGAERDEALGESGRLNARVGELEEKLSLLQSPQTPAPLVNGASGAGSDRSGPTIAAGPASAAVLASPEPPGGAVKNFTSPAWVPNYFGNENAPILGNPIPHPPRSALESRDKAA